MKAIVTIPAYDRLDLFRQCLESLERNDQSLFDVIVAPDKTSAEGARKIEEIAYTPRLCVSILPPPKTRMGPNANTIRVMNAAKQVNDQLGGKYSHIICMGSDLLVSNNFVHDLLVLSDAFDAYSVVPITGRYSLQDKLEHMNSIMYGSISGTNLCIPTHHWNTISPIVTAISERFHKFDWTERDVQEQRIVMRSMLEAARKIETKFTKPMIDHMGIGDINTGEDGLIVTALAMYGIPMVSYCRNRASHPSDTGVHTTRQVYEEHYAGVVVDDLPKADPSKFRFF